MEESYDFGYGLLKEYWGKGIVTEASLLVIEQFKKDNISYITATHDINNPANGTVMRKIGMSYKYTYEEIWQPKNFLVQFRMYQLNLSCNENNTFMKYWNNSKVKKIESQL